MGIIRNQMSYLLYIHPDTHLIMDALIPIGVIGLMNSVDVPVKGKLWYEVTNDDIINARVIALDLHWYQSLPSFIEISNRIRSLDPSLPIVAGGYTASAFSPLLIQKKWADYVVIGDADAAFPVLINNLFNSKATIKSLTNVCCEGNLYPAITPISDELFNQIDYQNWSFMPSLVDYSKKIQQAAPKWKYTQSMFPYITVYRGCGMDPTVMPCKYCLGNIDFHKRYSNRNPVFRTPLIIQKDIDYFIHNGFKFISIVQDFVSLYPGLSDKILNRKFDTFIYYAVFKLPSCRGFEQLLYSFKGGHIHVSDYASTPDEIYNPDIMELLKTLRKNGNYSMTLFIDKKYFLKDKNFGERIHLLRKEFPFSVSYSDSWWSPAPVRNKDNTSLSEHDFNHFLQLAQKMPLREKLLRLLFKYPEKIPGFLYDSIYSWNTKIKFLNLKR